MKRKAAYFMYASCTRLSACCTAASQMWFTTVLYIQLKARCANISACSTAWLKARWSLCLLAVLYS